MFHMISDSLQLASHAVKQQDANTPPIPLPQVIASERQMNAKYSQAQKTADEWLKRAELAVNKGQDDLAREALKRRKAFQENADKLRTQLDAQTRATEQLQANARTLESKLAEAKNKKETLKARAAAAKSSQEIQEMIGGLRLNSSSAWAAFDKMEEKVLRCAFGAMLVDCQCRVCGV
jgi:phage shock protein A